MAIRDIVTRGYGTFGAIPMVVRRGYGVAAAGAAAAVAGAWYPVHKASRHGKGR
jgi:hypothetical protein